MMTDPIEPQLLNPNVETMLDLVLLRTESMSEERAFSFLLEGEETAEEHLTFAELGLRAKSLAADLQAHGNVGDRALVLLPSGLDYVVALLGCFLAGVVAVPAFPPGRRRSKDRLINIASDSGAKFAISTSTIHERFLQQCNSAPASLNGRWLYVDQIEANPSEWTRPDLRETSLAVLQYTSGSTTSPKGVMITHGNLLHNVETIRQGFQLNEDSTGVFWLPLFHDMGLVGGILSPLYIGRPAIHMAPSTFLRNPFRWLSTLSRARATVSGAPCSAYELCARRITPEQRQRLDLSCWKVAFCGAEAIHPEVMETFASTFADCGFRPDAFYPCYGLAEATLLVTGGQGPGKLRAHSFDREALGAGKVESSSATNGTARRLTGCGAALREQKLVIVDPQTHQRVDASRIGEIWVRGESVAQGYWNRPEESKHSFQAHLSDTGEGPFLRSGDLGFVHEGELFVTGRLKDLIVIRGTNHYPEDIERTVALCHPAIRQGSMVAFSVESNHQERLVIAAEVQRQQMQDPEEVLGPIRDAVFTDHELSVAAIALLKSNQLLRTTSGKIQRHKCREAFLGGNWTELARWEVPGLWAKPTNGVEIANHQDERREDQDHPGVNGNGKRNVIMPASFSRANDVSEISPEQNVTITAGAIEQYLQAKLAHLLGLEPEEIELEINLSAVGVDSITAVELMIALEDRLGDRLQPELLLQHPTVRDLTGYLMDNYKPEQLVALTQDETIPKQSAVSQNTVRASEQPSTNGYPRENCLIDEFPEVVRFREQRGQFGLWGAKNPYYRPVEKIRDTISTIDGQDYVGYSGYDYLGLTQHPDVVSAAKDAIDALGTSVSASRLVWGERDLHQQLEQALAELLGAEDCVVFNAGYLTNVSTIGHLLGPADLVVYDALSHNSLFTGCALSGARRIAFPHNDWKALDEILHAQRSQHRRALIVLEGVYSMDGDYPDLPRFLEVKHRHHAMMMIDEAHSIGVLGASGAGINELFHVEPDQVEIRMGTLSKSFASCGGYVAGSKSFIEYLRYTAPGLVYSVGLPPASTAAALQAVRVLRAEPERAQLLHERADLFLKLAKERGFNTGSSQGTSVIPIILKDSARCIAIAEALYRRGIIVHPIISPAVEENAARLRFFICATHTVEQIHSTINALAEEIDKERINSAEPKV